ncbi:hypothetical protein ACFPK9_07030 [Rubritalea spongiae]|uniref:ABC transporter permease n=1 Tax=Rubritalea spongiae TaxID=430797 RepID=A0ABW5E1F3_9BACT
MKSMILIPTYLWKNTFKRWLENPISPLSKLLVSTILSLLALLILIFFSETKEQLYKRLKSSGTYDYHLVERVAPEDSLVRIQQNFKEEKLWKDIFGSEKIHTYRQTSPILRWNDTTLPVLIYSLNQENEEIPLNDQIQFLTTSPNKYGPYQICKSNNIQLIAKTSYLGEQAANTLNLSRIVKVPIEIFPQLASAGFFIRTDAHFDSTEEVKMFDSLITSYFAAENIDIQTISAISLLQEIKALNSLQDRIRIGIVVTCGLISALIIGTIAVLEYHSESYLLALLRSFGVPSFILLLHAFIENIIVVGLGVLVTSFVWKPIYGTISSQINDFQLSNAQSITLPLFDIQIIIMAAGLGVSLAMIPVAFGLRKPPGLILQ